MRPHPGGLGHHRERRRLNRSRSPAVRLRKGSDSRGQEVIVDSRSLWRPLLALSAAATLLAGCTSSGVAKGPPPSPITSLASYRALSLPPDAVRFVVATREAHALLNA